MNNEIIINKIDKRIQSHLRMIDEFKEAEKKSINYKIILRELINEHEAVLKELRLLKLDIQNI